MEIDEVLQASMWMKLTHITLNKEATLCKDPMLNVCMYMKFKNLQANLIEVRIVAIFQKDSRWPLKGAFGVLPGCLWIPFLIR